MLDETHRKPGELERCRLRGLALLKKGLLPVEVARRVGVDRRSVRRWKAAARRRSKAGVRYHVDSIARPLHALDWSPQKPARRALGRDKRAIRRWVREDWSRVRKTPRGGAGRSSSLLMQRSRLTSASPSMLGWCATAAA